MIRNVLNNLASAEFNCLRFELISERSHSVTAAGFAGARMFPEVPAMSEV